MKFLVLALALGFSQRALASEEICSCKCVVTESDGTLSTMNASGKDREEAGENLKKKLREQKCELSPVCEGSC